MTRSLVPLFLSICFLFTPTTQAHAGVIDYVKSLFIAEADQKETISDVNSQTASFLKPMTASISSAVGETSIADDSAIISNVGPSGTMADIQDFAPKIETYIVKEGDSLGKIGKIYGVSVNTIMWANNLTNAKALKIGQTLIILPVSGVQHTVVKGDTIQTIAKKYSGDVDEILKYNGLSESDKLAIGDTVIIPDGEIQIDSTVNTTKSATVYKGLPNYVGYYIKPAVNVFKTQGIHGHNAVDLAPLSHKEGVEPILAAASGEVVVARSNNGWNGGYGKLIIISHPNGTQTVYGHCYTILVNEGDHVEQGQIIGVIGNTGKSTGPHLHFEIRGAKNPF